MKENTSKEITVKKKTFAESIPEIRERSEELKTQNRHLILALESFVNQLNQKPSKIKSRQKHEYVPISHVQTKLDELFGGLWQTKNVTLTPIANELVCTLELWVWHPIIQDWIVRTGVAASMIRMKSGVDLTDYNGKIKNALEMDAPHAVADAIKNAAKSLGKAFGRDLNRDFEDNYKPILSTAIKAVEIEDARQQIITSEDVPAIMKLWNSNPSWHSVQELVEVYKDALDTLQTLEQ